MYSTHAVKSADTRRISPKPSIRQHSSAYVCIRTRIKQQIHAGAAYVGIRRHPSAYVSALT
jgi:hypothetical protein